MTLSLKKSKVLGILFLIFKFFRWTKNIQNASRCRDITDTTEIAETDKDAKIHPGYDKCTVQDNQETSEIVKRLEIVRE